MSERVFFKPEEGWSGDYIPFYWNGKWRLFFLLDRRQFGKPMGGVTWNLVETEDFVHFQPQGVMLPSGGENGQDLYVFTGSVIRVQDQFHIFYTGHNPLFMKQGLPQEKIMHATSSDLHSWQKHPEDTFAATEGFEPNDWRDPFVFFDYDDNQYHMLLAARRVEGPLGRRGCTAHLTSKDLTAWAPAEPLWTPDSYFTHECPDYFKMCDWYYLIFSEFSSLYRTRYVMSKNPRGPWIVPEQDVFDTRAYYAAKSFSDGEKRYLFGWIATRDGDTDDGSFQWGGSLPCTSCTRWNGELPAGSPKAWRPPGAAASMGWPLKAALRAT